MMDGRRRGRRRRQDRSMPPRSLFSLSSLLAMSSPPSLHPSLFRSVDGACSFALRAHGLCRRCENAVGGDGVDCSRVRQARGSRGRPSDAPGRLDGSHKRKRLARTASGRRIKQERANRGRELGRPSTYALAHLTHRRGPAQRMRPRGMARRPPSVAALIQTCGSSRSDAVCTEPASLALPSLGKAA
jgi:hypothetical protein